MRSLELLPILALAVSGCGPRPEPKILTVEPPIYPPTLISEVPTEEFIAENFSEKIKSSQKSLDLTYQLLVNEAPVTFNFRMGSTVVDLEGTDYSDFLLVISAGHGFSLMNLDKKIYEHFKQLGNPNVYFQNEELKSITLGDTITLDRSQFGLYSEFYSVDGTEDFAFLAISKKNLSEEALEQIIKDAVPASSISFAPQVEEQRYYGVCYPKDNGGTPAEANGVKSVGEYEDLIYIKPWKKVREECSGNGVFVKDEQGKVKLVASVARFVEDEDTAIIYPFLNLGEDRFFESVKIAVEEVSSDVK